jgi:hypothetical protein
MKLYTFRTIPLSIIRSFSLYTQQWYISYRQLPSCLQNCMTYTIAVCKVTNSWWWREELSETFRVSLQNKFERLVHLVGFIITICHDARSHERNSCSRFSPQMWQLCMSASPFKMSHLCMSIAVKIIIVINSFGFKNSTLTCRSGPLL